MSSTSPITTIPKATVSMLTYNVWFEQNYLERFQMIVLEILQQKPDIICLQEIIHVPESLVMLQTIGYKCFVTNSNRPYRELIGIYKDSGLVFHKQLSIPFSNSVMGRELLVVELHKTVQSKPISFHVGVSHLESMYQFKKNRLQQLGLVFKSLGQFKNGFFLADTNLHIDQSLKIPDQWNDCFNVMGTPLEHKYTWDGKTNPHIKSKSRKRFDRIFYKSSTIKPTEFKLIGTKTPQSDHYGVLVTFSL